VCLRVKIQNAMQVMALANGLRRDSSLQTQAGQRAIASLPLSRRLRQNEIEKLNQRLEQQACARSAAWLLMTHPGRGTGRGVSDRTVSGESSRLANSNELDQFM
jgi:hypothetical protein